MPRISDRVFLVSGPDRLQAVWTYYVSETSSANVSDPAALWAGWNGILLFSNAKIDPAKVDDVVTGLARALGTPARSPVPWRMVAWFEDPALASSGSALYASQSAPGVFSIRKRWTAAWGAFAIHVGPSLTLRYDSAAGVLRLRAKPQDVNLIQFSIRGPLLRVGYSPDGFDIPIRLEGVGAGSLRIAVGIDPSVLIEGFRASFLYRSAGTGLAFPMVAPILRTVDRFRAFDLWLNPIRPLDSRCTRFSVDNRRRLAEPGISAQQVAEEEAGPLEAPYFSTVTGAPLTLVPLDPGPSEPEAIAGGFAFSVDSGDDATLKSLYLSPCGLWVVKHPPPVVRLMAGVFGEEFLLLRPGDRLSFQSNQPTSAASQGGGPMSASTTSWVGVEPHASPPPAYFGQPSASSFFGSADPSPAPPALDMMLSSFAAASPFFPLAPYGGVYAPVPSDSHTHYPAPFAGSPDILLGFEAAALADRRHAILTQDSAGPVFLPRGATAPDARLARAATPQGLLFDLRADGMSTRLTLAQSPRYPGVAAQVLCFKAPAGGALPPSLANVLTRDQAFIVISTLPSDMGGTQFLNRLDLAGFRLLFDVGRTGGAILVFKFNTRASLAAMAADASAWADADLFNENPAATSQRLVQSIVEAASLAGAATAGAGSSGLQIDSFATFNALASQPEWTGALAFDVQIDGNGMPPGLQMLLGGVQGDLRAHHLGVQANRIESGEGGLTLVDSSLFGVIHYQAPAAAAGSPAAGPDYQVEHLRIAWSNSKIVQSDVTIGVTLPTLFGRAVWLRAAPLAPGFDVAPANTLQIAGASQTVDGVDTVTFASATPFYFDFQAPASGPAAVRVLRTVEVTQARLVPVSSAPAGPDAPTQVTLHLLMDGQAVFAPDPFAKGFDLYSYGADDGEGLAFTGLPVEIAFALDPAQGSMVASSKTVTLREDRLVPAPKPTGLRRDSFLGGFPAQVSAFLAAPGGPAVFAPGARPIHIWQLEPPPAAASATSGASAPATPPCTTATPVWALEYDVHLGSLGALSDDHAGLAAKLYIGWGPSPAAPGDDAAALLMALPQLTGGVAGFSLQGLLKTEFGDGNLRRYDLEPGPVYAMTFGNVRLSLLGYDFPPRTMVDFFLFAGAAGTDRKASNLAWFLAAEPMS